MKFEIIKLEDMSDSREIMMKKTPRSILAFIYTVLIFIIVALFWAFIGKKEIYVMANGNIRPINNVSTISIINSGRISKIHYKNGNDVKSGEILFEIDSTSYEKQRDILKEEISRKENDIVSNKRLLKDIGVSSSYYINIKSLIDKLNDEVSSLNLQLNNVLETIKSSKIIAVNEGNLVLNENYSVGDFVTEGTKLGTIIPYSSKFKVILYVPESSISKLFIGQRVEYSLNSAYGNEFGKTFGEITNISYDSFIDENTHQSYYRAESSFPDTYLKNKKGDTLNLRVGMSIKTHIIIGTQSIFTYFFNKITSI